MTAVLTAGKGSRRRAGGTQPWLFVAPAIVIVGLLTVAPLVYGIYLSLTNWSLTTSPSPSLEGVTAYQVVLAHSDFWPNLLRTLIWTVGTLIVEIVVALPLSLLLNLRTPITGAVTGFIMIPWITPFVVLAYAWLFLYDGQSGPLHALFHALGLVGAASPLADPKAALWSIVLISGWKGVPFLTVALLAARKGISDEMYEAAALDGTTRFAAFRYLTLPLLRATLGAMSVVLAVQAFYSFDLVWILNQGGPGTSSMLLGVQLFQTFFDQASPGQAAALGTVMLLLAVVCIVPVLRASSRSVDS